MTDELNFFRHQIYSFRHFFQVFENIGVCGENIGVCSENIGGCGENLKKVVKTVIGLRKKNACSVTDSSGPFRSAIIRALEELTVAISCSD